MVHPAGGRLCLQTPARPIPHAPGIKLPASAASLLPRTQVPFDEGLAGIRAQTDRVGRGEKMTQPSPALGRVRHEQWVLLHMDHCRMHFGFIQCGD